MAVKTLSIFDVEAQKPNEPIWVLNNSKRSRIRDAGNIIIGIQQLRGDRTDPLVILQTWLPQRVNVKFTRDQILTSNEFRDALFKELIVLIDDQTATRLLAKPEAKREHARLKAKEDNVAAAGSARTIAMANVTIVGQDGKVDQPEEYISLNGKSQESEDPANGLEPRFKAWADRLADGKDDIDVKNEVQSQDQLRKRQVLYLLHVLDSDNFPKTVAMLNRAIGRA